MKKSKNKIAVAIVIIIILSIVLGRTVFLSLSEEQNLEEENTGVYANLIEVEKNKLTEELNFIGTVKSDSSSTLSPKITGEVNEILIDEGDYVKKGDLLLTLDKSQLEASMKTIFQKEITLNTQISYLKEQISTFYNSNPIMDKIRTVESNIAFQESELSKMEKLYEGDAISKTELDKAKHQLDTLKIQKSELNSTADNNYNQLVHEKNMSEKQLQELKSNLEEIELSMSNSQLAAPYDGIISQVMIEEGELAMPNKPAVIISSTENQKIVVNLSEADLKKVKIDTPVEFKIGSEGELQQGRVTFLSSNVNPATRVGSVEIMIDSNKAYSTGSSAEVKFILSEIEDQILISASSVKALTEKNVVYIYKEGTVKEQKVELGKKTGNMYQILSGLEEGDVIAENNLDSLYDGTSIYTFEEEEI
ncbi:MAG: efflux RND transporter periplasmic adaptor subunit [Eubacteriales bacterium]